MSAEDLVARAGRTMDFDGMLDLLLEAVAQIEALTAERDTARAEKAEAELCVTALERRLIEATERAKRTAAAETRLRDAVVGAAEYVIEQLKATGLAPGEIVAIPRDLPDPELWEFETAGGRWLPAKRFLCSVRSVCRPSTPTESGDER